MTRIKKFILVASFTLLSIGAQASVEVVCQPSSGCHTVNDLGTGIVIIDGKSHTVQHPGNDLYIIDGQSHMIRPFDDDTFFIDGRLERY